MDTPPEPKDKDGFRLEYLETLDDPEVASKLLNIIKSANKDMIENINSLHSEVKTPRANLQQHDGEVKELQCTDRTLQEQNGTV